ncbi:glucagon-like peptide 2 receptor [Pristis pectinata]|uniref:glucagon-like peptide 2 receptor n=1 Tax=Pristis pectinata TaxID=685728 RepID=UPI00223DF3FD|nr:glucagon-like peptide 2 receptor [Pristis pectinata]
MLRPFHHLQGTSQEKDGNLFTCLEECSSNNYPETPGGALAASEVDDHGLNSCQGSSVGKDIHFRSEKQNAAQGLDNQQGTATSVKDLQDMLVRDRIIFKTRESSLRELLLFETELSPEKSIQTCIVQSWAVNGTLLEDTVSNWSLYKDQCLQNLTKSSAKTGIFCNETFDQFVCWPASYPGNVSEPCPWYLPWIKPGSTKRVYRYCLDNGSWLTFSNSTVIWRDHSECNEDSQDIQQNVCQQNLCNQHRLLKTLQLIYTVGYSISLSSLSLAILILLWLRRLHCTRNYIHINLFASFILRALAVLIKDIFLKNAYSKHPDDEMGWKSFFDTEASNGCKVAQVFMHYFIGATFFWLLVEGIYLHKLIVLAVLSEKSLLKQYVLIGWAFPLLFVIPWIISKIIYENEGCWAINRNMAIWWIIRGPVLFAIIMNFYIFIMILKTLLSKLKAQQRRFNDYKYRLTRSTLVLIPLLGIHEFAFTFLLDEHVQGLLLNIRLFLQLAISSFQGFLVALLYCFSNGEVQAELKTHWRSWLLANDFECSGCMDKQFKYLGKCSKPRSNSYINNSSYCYSDTRTSSVQLSTAPMSELQIQKATPMEQFTQTSISESSEGDMGVGDSQI